MCKRALLLALFLIAVLPVPVSGQVLTYILTAFDSPPDVLFDSHLGTLTSVGLEFKFRAGAIYEYLGGASPGTVFPFDLAFSAEAPFAVAGMADDRAIWVPWTLGGHFGGQSSGASFGVQSTGSFARTYTDPGILDFFTRRGDDEALIVYTSDTGWIHCSPEEVFDDRGNRYDSYFANAQFGDGIVLTYNYNLAPVPEPGGAFVLGAGLALLLLPGLRGSLRRLLDRDLDIPPHRGAEPLHHEPRARRTSPS